MMLIVESTYANEREAAARDQGHLTPALLLAELDVLNQAWGRLPTVLVVHRHPEAEAAMARQFAEAPSDWEIRLPEAATTWDI
jgi:cAMP phosphodiesterase